MIEYASEEVDPANSDEVIAVYETFGWQTVSSEEIYNEHTEVTGMEVKSYNSFMRGFTGKDGRVDVNTRKVVTNYVALRFARDTQMAHYDELRTLESEYCSIMAKPKAKKPTTLTLIGCAALALIIISIIYGISESVAAEPWEIVVCVLVPLIFIPAIILSWRRYKKMAARDAVDFQRVNEIFDRAAALLSDGE